MLLISGAIFIGNQSDVQSIHQMRMVANTGMMLIYKYLVNKSINSFLFEKYFIIYCNQCQFISHIIRVLGIETYRYILNAARVNLIHPAGTSIVSDICNLSNISDIAPLTLGSMEKSFFTTYFVSHRKPI